MRKLQELVVAFTNIASSLFSGDVSLQLCVIHEIVSREIFSTEATCQRSHFIIPLNFAIIFLSIEIPSNNASSTTTSILVSVLFHQVPKQFQTRLLWEVTVILRLFIPPSYSSVNVLWTRFSPFSGSIRRRVVLFASMEAWIPPSSSPREGWGEETWNEENYIKSLARDILLCKAATAITNILLTSILLVDSRNLSIKKLWHRFRKSEFAGCRLLSWPKQIDIGVELRESTTRPNNIVPNFPCGIRFTRSDESQLLSSPAQLHPIGATTLRTAVKLMLMSLQFSA